MASGGHSHIVAVEDYESFRLLGCTRDDAAGEAFDKVARALGLPYPGGPELEKLALEGDAYAYPLRAGFNEGPGLDMSFSGLKTAAVNLLHNAAQRQAPLCKADLAASFQRAVCHTLTEKAVHAAQAQGSQALALAGGVSANMYLRAMLQEACQAAGLRFYCPDFRFCTDNAAMIGCAGHYALLAGRRSSLALNGMPALALDAHPA